MDPSYVQGAVLDPSKCSKLSMEEKRELVYELSKWSHGASEMLQSWSRQEILQILCAEMGKERKYTGLTKLKIIENLLKIVSEKKLQEKGVILDLEAQPSSEIGQRTSKKPRKTDHPNRLFVAANNVSVCSVDSNLENTTYCKNSACKAKLNHEDTFCKRCSCCICCQYDDNKDPSLWLLCCSEPPFQGLSCGMSCHLECALRHERSGITKDRKDRGFDGSFNCVSCGKVNDLLGCWRKQLIIARDTRRVDILCYRIALSQKLLNGTKRFQMLHDIVEAAVRKLEEDVGPLTGLPVKTARGIVNRLSSGPEIQRLCASAVESLDLMLSKMISNSPFSAEIKDTSKMVQNIIKFEVAYDSSLIVVLGAEDLSLGDIRGYTLWHRKANDIGYAVEPTFTLFSPNTRSQVSGLIPDTDYIFKVVYFDCVGDLGTYEVQYRTSGSGYEAPNRPTLNHNSLVVDRSHSPVTNCSSLSNPSSVEDETNNFPYGIENDAQEDNGITCCPDTEKIVPAKSADEIIICNTIDERGTPGDAVSILDEDETIGKVNPMPKYETVNLVNKLSPGDQPLEEMSTDNGSSIPVQTGMECVPYVGTSEAGLPITPCKLENNKDGLGRSGRPKLINKDLDSGSGKEEPQAGSSSKKRSSERRDEECAGIGNKDFEYYVKVIRWLECDGHIETAFRQKFLTWYSLRANPQEVRIVKVFVDTLMEDPASLAGQLVDTFSDIISSKRSSVVPIGFCLKLWH